MKIYEELEQQLDSRFQKFLARRTPDYIVEVGSFDGEVIRQFGLASPYSKTVGFEANPRNFFRFCVGKNIQNMAVGNKTGSIKFYDSIIPGSEKTGSIFKKINESDDERREVTILSTTLDDFFNLEIRRKRSFVLIVDAEGSTWEVLKGAQNFLKNTIALKLEVETKQFWENQKIDSDVVSLLEDHILIAKNKDVKKDTDFQKNYYFITKHSPGAIIDFKVH